MTSSDNQPPVLLSNRYQVLSVLGDGGFGKTFLVEDTQMPSGRRCVLKQLKPIEDNPQTNQMVKDRFQREAAILEKLGEAHEQIPRLYANFSEAGQFYLVEEWVAGDTLTQRVQREGPLSETAVQTMIAQLLPAIAHVHQEGIVHRDIKPDNIILRAQDGKPVLIDFGAVKETMNTVIDSHAHSSHSIVVGTPGYMPAEQLSGRPVFASDIYSIGMTAIYALTGKIPQELDIDPRTGVLLWRQHAPNVSSEFANFLDCAIHMNAQSRFPVVQEMMSILNNVILNGMGGSTSNISETQQSSKTIVSAPSTGGYSSEYKTAAVAPGYAYQEANGLDTQIVSSQTIGQIGQTVRQSGQFSNVSHGDSGQWKNAVIVGGMVGFSVLAAALLITNTFLGDRDNSAPAEVGSTELPETSQLSDSTVLPSESTTQPSEPQESPVAKAPEPTIPQPTVVQEPSQASSIPPAPENSNGDYFSSGGWTTWEIIPREQHCLDTPDAIPSDNAPTLKGGEVIFVNADGNSPAARDRDGKPWFRVSGRLGSCYVRARDKYIYPSR